MYKGYSKSSTADEPAKYEAFEQGQSLSDGFL